jgi:hypothetical protein
MKESRTREATGPLAWRFQVRMRKEECLEELAEGIKLMIDCNKEEALRDDPRAEIIPLSVEIPEGA